MKLLQYKRGGMVKILHCFCFIAVSLLGLEHVAFADSITLDFVSTFDHLDYDYIGNSGELINVGDAIAFSTSWNSDYVFPTGGWDYNYAGMTTNLSIPGYSDGFHVHSYFISSSGQVQEIHYYDIVMDAFFYINIVDMSFSVGFAPVTGYYFKGSGYIAEVPEPSTLALWGVGAIAIGMRRRKN